MGIYRRIYCRKCRKDYELRGKVIKKKCTKCNQTLTANINNAPYYITYYYENKRMRELIKGGKGLAETVLQKRRVEIAENKYLDKRQEVKIKFSDFADEYIENHLKVNCSKGWLIKDRANIKRLKQFFQNKYLHEITSQNVEQYKAQRLREVSPSTVNKSLTSLKTVFNKAIAWEKFEGLNPVDKVKRLRVENKSLRYLEKEEIPRLLNCCAENIKPIVTVAIHTGMRKGEIFNLKWHDIDFKRGIIQLLKTKNNKVRHIPMNETVSDIIISIRKNPDSSYVFASKDGKPYNDIKRSFKTALNKARIKDFRFHDLRHTFASQLVMGGVDLNTVRELLGHSTIEMTLRYAHLSPNFKRQAVDTLVSRIATNSPRHDDKHTLKPTDSSSYELNGVAS